MIEFSMVNYEDIVEDLKELIGANHEETGPFPQREFKPNLEMYKSLSDRGSLAIFVAVDGDTLIGYGVFLLVPHMWYDNFLVAQSDIIYVKPENRGIDSKEFIEFMDEKLYSYFGVEGIVINVHAKRDFSGLLENMGYQHAGSSYSKYLGDS